MNPTDRYLHLPFGAAGPLVRVRHPGRTVFLSAFGLAFTVGLAIGAVFGFAQVGLAFGTANLFAAIGSGSFFLWWLRRCWVLFDPERRVLVVSGFEGKREVSLDLSAEIVIQLRDRPPRPPLVKVDGATFPLRQLDRKYDLWGRLVARPTPEHFLRQIAAEVGARVEP